MQKRYRFPMIKSNFLYDNGDADHNHDGDDDNNGDYFICI